MKKCTEILQGRVCTIFERGEPAVLLLQPVDAHDLEILDREAELIASGTALPFALAAFSVGDWNDELSPWPAPPAFRGRDFGGKGEETLCWLTERLLPALFSRFDWDPSLPVILGGYSLAALFAIWGGFETAAFSAVCAASPSVWFPGWIEYIREREPKAGRIYLSLGDREEKTKNAVMSGVGENIRETAALLQKSMGTENTTLEWNPGNHFMDSEKRCARGFLWCLKGMER